MPFYNYMKNKPVLITIIAAIILIGGLLVVNRYGKPKETTVTATNGSVAGNTSIASMSVMPVEKIEVVNFFGTQRCASCLTLGNFTKKTLEEKFSSELESGKIVFKEINGELPENKNTVIKYQARGSSLFINAIRGEKDNITEDVTVWRLVNSEEQFVAYLENKLNSMLDK